MDKNRVRKYIILSVFFILVSVIAFVPPLAKTATFWVGYVFAIVAIVSQLYFIHVSFELGEDAKSKFYGFPIAKIGVTYLGAQVAFSIAEMFLAGLLASWIAVLINVVFLALAILGCIAAETMRDEIEHQDVVLKTNVNNMRAMQSLSLAIVGLTSDEELKNELQKVADEFKFSDPVSSEDTLEIEKELENQLKEIQAVVVEGDSESAKKLCKNVVVSLAERNRVCKLGK